jgi:uncharacterized SAM-binding protein YcdF (DUF218 family)
MVLLATKVLTTLGSPLGLAIALALLGLICWRRLGRWGIGLAVLVLWGASIAPSADWLLGQLEAANPARPISSFPHADAAIVLGGSLGQPLPPRLEPDLSDAADRVVYAARLFRAGKVDAVLVTGGNLPWLPSAKPESQLVTGLLIEFGVPSDAIVQDPESQTTRENAINSAAIMKARGWQTGLLVTSAAHMPRALAAFRRVGLKVIPATTDVRVVYRSYNSPLDFLPDAGALAETSAAIKERIGMLVYWLRGWV